MHAFFRFYGDLEDLIDPGRRGGFERTFDETASVKDMVEALGVPHTEIDLLLVNGESVDFGHGIEDGDRVAAYPRFGRIDVSALSRVQPQNEPHGRFVLDVHLGRLARLLRLLGFDVVYGNDLDDVELVDIAVEQHRILLTRDLGILKRRHVTHGAAIRSTNALQQAIYVVRRFDVADDIEPFTRCMRCNSALERVDIAEVSGELPPMTKANYDTFARCVGCQKLYWRGAHSEHLERLVDTIRRRA